MNKKFINIVVIMLSILLLACDSSARDYEQFVEQSKNEVNEENLFQIISSLTEYPNGLILFRLGPNSFLFPEQNTAYYPYDLDSNVVDKNNYFSFRILSPEDNIANGPSITTPMRHDTYSGLDRAVIDVALKEMKAENSSASNIEYSIQRNRLAKYDDPRDIVPYQAYEDPNIHARYVAAQNMLDELTPEARKHQHLPSYERSVYYVISDPMYKDAIGQPLMIGCYYNSEQTLSGFCEAFYFYESNIELTFSFSPKALGRWREIYQDVNTFVAKHHINRKKK